MGDAPALLGRPLEDIAEVFLQSLQRFLPSVTGNPSLIEIIKTPEFVDAVHMVGVVVGVQHAVDVADVINQALLAEVRGRVDQGIVPAVADQHGSAQALVANVVRTADRAIAA